MVPVGTDGRRLKAHCVKTHCRDNANDFEFHVCGKPGNSAESAWRLVMLVTRWHINLRLTISRQLIETWRCLAAWLMRCWCWIASSVAAADPSVGGESNRDRSTVLTTGWWVFLPVTGVDRRDRRLTHRTHFGAFLALAVPAACLRSLRECALAGWGIGRHRLSVPWDRVHSGAGSGS